ncbi:hypothetical protein BH11MYX2_BH11MYX2_16600 [soil metagenome]
MLNGDVIDGSDSNADGGSEAARGAAELVSPGFNECTAVHQRLLAYSLQRSRLDVAESFDLVRAYELKVHTLYACSSFYEYMERMLGYAPHTARERMRVARSLRALPKTMLLLAKGRLPYSHARELTRVVTAETEEAWLEATVDHNATQVQRLVAQHEPGDLPSDPVIPDLRPKKMTLELPPEVMALWREARVALQDEHGIGEVSDADLMETLCRRMLTPGTGVEGPANHVGYEQCPDCKRTQVNGAGRMLDVRREMAERLLCDVRILGDLRAAHPDRITSSVTPRMRVQIFARDKCRCQVPGCRATRHLEIHHIIPQALGGLHVLWNVILICDGHHRALHDGRLSITGRAPLEVVFQWKFTPIDVIEMPTDPALPLEVPAWMTGGAQTFDAFDRAVAKVKRAEREREYELRRARVPGPHDRFAAFLRPTDPRRAEHDRDAQEGDVPRGTRRRPG